MLKALRRFFGGVPPAPHAAAPPIDVETLLEAPGRALAEGRDAEAIALLEAVLRAHPDLAQAHLLLGTVLHRRGEIEDARDSYTLAAHYAPGSGLAHYHLGLLELEQGRLTAALGALEQALARGGAGARVHNALGAVHAKARDFESAVLQFRRAIALEPGFAEAHSNLGYVLLREIEDYAAGAAHIEQAMALEPERPATRLNWAMVLQQRGRGEEALAVYDGLIEADPALDEARLNRGLIRLARGEFAAGWQDYEARKALAPVPTAGDGDEWDGSDLRDGTIALYGEQGIGDEIMFASCVPDIVRTARRCVIHCNPRLVGLFRLSFPCATVLAAGAHLASPEPRPRWRAMIGSVPRFLRTARADFPAHAGYLRADPARAAYWKERLAALPGRRKIGISWRGGAPSTRRSLRSIPLDEWRRVLRLDGVDFVSLQYTDCGDEIAEVARAADVRVHHWPEALGDYEETAALVSALDLVISVQTAVVHLAGALGVATWALVPETAEWRYGEHAETMPWYPSVKLIRKQRGEDWSGVLARVEARLAAHLEGAPGA
jgi:tetratricopeptide (TPR) repeat protein